MISPSPETSEAFRNLMKRHKKLFWAESIIFVFLGIVGLVAPVAFSLTLNFFIGWLCISLSVTMMVRAFRMRNENTFSSLLQILLYWILGLLLVCYPISGVLTLDLLLGIFFLLDGSMKVYKSTALQEKGVSGWLLMSGLMSLVLAAIIFATWSKSAPLVLGVLVGINILCTGLAHMGILYNLSDE